ncbi:hypothetical protein ACVWWG_002572 [Bradyrhizobium sp. LB7.2]
MSAQGTAAVAGKTTGTPKGAWTVTFLLFLFMLVNFADKIVVGLAGVPIMADLNLQPEQFGLLGSSFFFLFSISAIVVGFIVNKVPTRWVLLALAVVWALAQFPMVGTVSFTTFLICRIVLGAGEGPAFSVAAHAIYKWFPDEKRTLPTAILSQGSAFGVILAVPALNWIIVNHSWHYAFGALGVVGLMWVCAWLAFGQEGPLEDTQALAATQPKIPYLRLLTSRTFLGCVIATFGAYWALSLGLTWFTPFIVKGLGFTQSQARLRLDPALGVRRHNRYSHGLDLAGDECARLYHAHFARRARLGAADHRRSDPGDDAACAGRWLADRATRRRLGPVRRNLCRLPADARRVHADVAARRDPRDLRRALHALRHHRAERHGRRDPALRQHARRLHDRLHHQRGGHGRLRSARAASALAEHGKGQADR